MSSLKTNRIRTIVLVITGSVLGIVATLSVLVGLNTMKSDSTNESFSHQTSVADADRSQAELKNPSSTSSRTRESDLGLLKFLSLAPSAFERTEALYSLLLSADTSLLTKLLEQSKNIGSESLQHTTQTAIIRRFTTLDPKLALTTIDQLSDDRHNPLITSVFVEWSQLDLNEAITHAKTLEQSRQYAALQGILDSQHTLSIDEKQALTEKFQIDLDEFEQGTFAESVADEWQKLVADDQSNVAQTASLIRLAQTLVNQSGLEAIAQIDESLTDPILKKVVLGSVLQQAILADPHSTLQQVLNFEGEMRELAMETIARAWASIDPKDAFESISLVESPRARRQMLEHFVTAWANYDPKDLFDNFDLIPENLRVHAEEHAIRTLMRTAPEDSAQYLAEISDEFLKFELTMELAIHWADKNALDALNWALAHEFAGASLQREVLNTILRRLAAENPELALQTALDQPVDSMGLGLEATVIAEVARTDIERALSMLAPVREGYTKSFSSIAVGRALVSNNDIDRALALGEQLPEESRDMYYNLVVNEWAYSDPKSLVARMDELPSTDAKYRAAMDLIRFNVGRNVLSKEQVSYVKRFLPADYNSETGRRGSESAQFARLNNLENMTEEEREQVQKDFQLMIMDGRFRRYRAPSQ
ncbi:MAG: hypothetical protein F4X56_00620 [Gammaproteobacteria bacterium]|nr:hypothetical protein [Gammaproteobacteria bacterium]MYC24402.1 hypothetical protein [Gammaproteobacteria bacterium]